MKSKTLSDVPDESRKPPLDDTSPSQGFLIVTSPRVVERSGAPENASSDELWDKISDLLDARTGNQKWTPYSDEDSNIEIGRGKAKRMRLDELLTKAFVPLGYRRVDKLVYRADWSTEAVEHILSIDTYGNPKVFLTGDAGMRNKQAETFAERCQERYGSKVGRQVREEGYTDPPWFCPMHFVIGRIFGWDVRDSLDTGGLSPDELAQAVVDPIRNKLIPYVGVITTERRFLDLLKSDKPPMDWIRGPYYRAALVAYLARKLGDAKEKTKSILMTKALYINNGIDKDWLTPETYIDHILDDADAAFGS